MIPIKNKKKSLKVTVEEMTNFALNYVEKFAPSKQGYVTHRARRAALEIEPASTLECAQ